MIKRVSNVAKDNPENTTMPNGLRNSPPSPNPNAKGNNPSTVVIVVIKIGRSLWGAAMVIAVKRSHFTSITQISKHDHRLKSLAMGWGQLINDIYKFK